MTHSFILQIDRIQNKFLYQQYRARKALIERQNPKGHQNEQKLWHGTSVDTVPKINTQGFNRSFCGKNGKIVIINLLLEKNSNLKLGVSM